MYASSIPTSPGFTYFSRAVLCDIVKHYQDPTLPYPKEENPLLFELTAYLEGSGLSDPFKKVNYLVVYRD